MTKQANKTNARVITAPEYKTGVQVGQAAKRHEKVQDAAVAFLRNCADGDGNIPAVAGQQFRAGYIVGRAGVAVFNRDPSDKERQRYDGAARVLLSRARKSFELETGKKTKKDARGGTRKPSGKTAQTKGKTEPKNEIVATPQAALDRLAVQIAKARGPKTDRVAAYHHLQVVAAFLKLKLES